MTQAQREAALVRQRAYVARNKEKVKVRMAEYYRQNKDRAGEMARQRHLMQKYGITPLGYASMLFSQSFRCACCQSERPGGPGNKFAVDHDHSTGEVRGLLCFRCNTMIGHAEENIDILAACVFYLERHGKARPGPNAEPQDDH